MINKQCGLNLDVNANSFAKYTALGRKTCWLSLKQKKISTRKKHEYNLRFYSIILQLQTNHSIYSYIISYKNKHIIVHLTEVLVSYTPKFNVLHMDLSITAGIVAGRILMPTGYED